MDQVLEKLTLNCLLIQSQKLLKISELYVLEKKDLAIKAVPSIELSLTSWLKEVTLQIIMALVFFILYYIFNNLN